MSKYISTPPSESIMEMLTRNNKTVDGLKAFFAIEHPDVPFDNFFSDNFRITAEVAEALGDFFNVDPMFFINLEQIYTTKNKLTLQEKSKAYCEVCNDEVSYHLVKKLDKISYELENGEKELIEYVVIEPLCNNCSSPLYTPETNDANVNSFLCKVNYLYDIVPEFVVQEYLLKEKLTPCQLDAKLCLEEGTIEKYLNGSGRLPFSASNRIKELYPVPRKMKF